MRKHHQPPTHEDCEYQNTPSLCVPGKRTLTENLPPRMPSEPSTIQRKQQLDTQQSRSGKTAPLADWTNVVYRPDVYQRSVQRKSMSEIGRLAPSATASRDDSSQLETVRSEQTDDRLDHQTPQIPSDSERNEIIQELEALLAQELANPPGGDKHDEDNDDKVEENPRLGHDQSGSTVELQEATPGTSLVAGARFSSQESQADAVAAEVMDNAGTSGVAKSFHGVAVPHLTPRWADSATHCQVALRHAESGAIGEANVSAAGGAPLAAGVRAAIETRTQTDLQNIRIHDDESAHEAAESLGAHAFAAGSHIWFAKGAYQPNHATGQRLIAHEVTHVLQAATGSAPELQCDAKITLMRTHSREGKGRLKIQFDGKTYRYDPETLKSLRGKNRIDFDKLPRKVRQQVTDSYGKRLAKEYGCERFKYLLTVKNAQKASKKARKRAGKKAGEKIGKKLAQKIPILGIAVTLYFLSEDAKSKGWGGALASGVLDAIPYVGWVKGAYEIGSGNDVIPDKG